MIVIYVSHFPLIFLLFAFSSASSFLLLLMAVLEFSFPVFFLLSSASLRTQ